MNLEKMSKKELIAALKEKEDLMQQVLNQVKWLEKEHRGADDLRRAAEAALSRAERDLDSAREANERLFSLVETLVGKIPGVDNKQVTQRD